MPSFMNSSPALPPAGAGRSRIRGSCSCQADLSAFLDLGQFARGRVELDRERLAVARRVESIDLTLAGHRFDALEAITRNDLTGLGASDRRRFLLPAWRLRLHRGLGLALRLRIGLALARRDIFGLVIVR